MHEPKLRARRRGERGGGKRCFHGGLRAIDGTTDPGWEVRFSVPGDQDGASRLAEDVDRHPADADRASEHAGVGADAYEVDAVRLRELDQRHARVAAQDPGIRYHVERSGDRASGVERPFGIALDVDTDIDRAAGVEDVDEEQVGADGGSESGRLTNRLHRAFRTVGGSQYPRRRVVSWTRSAGHPRHRSRGPTPERPRQRSSGRRSAPRYRAAARTPLPSRPHRVPRARDGARSGRSPSPPRVATSRRPRPRRGRPPGQTRGVQSARRRSASGTRSSRSAPWRRK